MKKIIKNIAFVIGIYAGSLLTPLKAQNIGINTTGGLPNAKAMLDVDVSASSTKMGLLVPRMTTAERNSITAPIPESLLIYNLTTQCFEAWNQTAGVWVTFGCIGCTTPGSPTGNTAIGAGTSSFTANWSLVAGATAYLLDVSTSPSFASFVSGFNGLNVGASTANAVGSLTCATTYYYRVRATNACGTSVNSNTITAVTLACPIPTVSACGTQIWAATSLNVGTMITAATAQTNNSIVEKHCYNDVAANCTNYGGLYQWSEMMNYTSTINCDPCGSSGRQGICPTGYHIPTDLEWSRYEFCTESTLAPIGSVSLNDFQTLTNWRGTNTGDKLKATSGNTPAWNGTNTSGFLALPGGWIQSNVHSSLNNLVMFWTATEEANPANAYTRQLSSGVSQSARLTYGKSINSLQVRCLQD